MNIKKFSEYNNILEDVEKYIWMLDDKDIEYTYDKILTLNSAKNIYEEGILISSNKYLYTHDIKNFISFFDSYSIHILNKGIFIYNEIELTLYDIYEKLSININYVDTIEEYIKSLKKKNNKYYDYYKRLIFTYDETEKKIRFDKSWFDRLNGGFDLNIIDIKILSKALFENLFNLTVSSVVQVYLN
jgi:hypothetical protein